MSDVSDSDNEGDGTGKRVRLEQLESDDDDNGDAGSEDEEDEEDEEDFQENDYSDEDGGASGSDAEEGSSARKKEDMERSRGRDIKSKKDEKKEMKKEKKEKKEKRNKEKMRQEKEPKAKKSRYGKSIFMDEAEVGGDDEDEDEGVREEAVQDHELDAFQLEAEARAATRHAANRRFQEASASDVVADIESRYRRQKVVGSSQAGYLGSAEGYMAETTRRSLVPGVNDPGIFMVRAKTGMEQGLVKAILLKCIDRQRKGHKLHIKSVFCTSTAGYVYIEAMNEPFAREAIQGLYGLYYSTLKQVPIPEMSMLLTLSVKKKPIREGQWARMRRGPNKGDLARVLRLLEGGSRALVQLVPRPDYEAQGKSKSAAMAAGATRPLQRKFLAESTKTGAQEVDRRKHPITFQEMDFWNNDYYSRGFLFKEVKVDTFLMHANDPLPRLEEMIMFEEKKQEGAGADSDEEDEEEGSGGGGGGGRSTWNSKQALMLELARLEEESGAAAAQLNVPFRAGDTVQVMEGEQRNLRGVVVSVNERTGLAVVQPLSEYQLGHLTIETGLLIKYIRPGAHVKVLSGQHLGQTGRVVSVYRSDGDNIAAVLTDGVNTEITVNMSHLQVTSEVSTGLNSLGGYELYDLLILNANDYGVVVFVGTEYLRVMTLNDQVKEVRPAEVKGKKPPSRGAPGAFDHLKNPLAVGDTVSVVEGTHAKKTGTIKHINRSVLWLHSTSHLANSGVFVVKGKSCLLAGSKINANSNTAATLLNAAFNVPDAQQQPGATLIRTQALRRGGGKGGGQDEEHGRAVKLTQGGFKGHLGRIVDSTNTHYSVELHGRMKVVSILKARVKFVDGDKPTMGDSYMAGGRDGGAGLIPSTPFLAAQTPQHLSGNETPGMFGSGNMTPSRPMTPGGDNLWHASTELEASTSGWDAAHEADTNGMWREDIDSSWVQPQHPQQQQQQQYQQQHYQQQQGYGGDSSSISWEGSSSSSSSSDSWEDSSSNVHEWGVDMIVYIRSGPDTGKYAIIAESPSAGGTVRLRMRESSSSGRSSDDNEVFSMPVFALRLGEPRRKDTVQVLSGPHRGVVAKVHTMFNADVVLVGMPSEIFNVNQLAWIHTR